MRSPQRGQSIAEFALVLPVLMLILLVVFDFGRAVFAYNTLANAAREGGRTAIVNQTVADIRSRAAAQAIALGLPSGDPGGCPASGGATSAAAGVCVAFRSAQPANLSAPCVSPAAIGCVAVVSAKWTYTAVTPVIGNLIGPIPIVAETRQSIERTCPAPSVPSPCPTR